MIDLNDFLDEDAVAAGWYLNFASGINDSGWITGHATNILTGSIHAFLLSPTTVSEPKSAVLIVAAVAALGLAGRRRWHAKPS